MSDVVFIAAHGINSPEVLEYMLHQPNSQRAIDEAAKLGMDVVFPEANQLQIDIDNIKDYEYMNSVLDVIDNHWGVTNIEEHPSKSGFPKTHATITLSKEVSATERVLLQACLGSDRKRELLSYLQILNGDTHPILFLELRKETVPTPDVPPVPLDYTRQYADTILKDEDIPY